MTSAEPMVMMEQPVSLGLSLPTRGRKDDPGCGRTAANGQEIIMPLAAPGVPAKAMMRPGKFGSVEALEFLEGLSASRLNLQHPGLDELWKRALQRKMAC